MPDEDKCEKEPKEERLLEGNELISAGISQRPSIVTGSRIAVRGEERLEERPEPQQDCVGSKIREISIKALNFGFIVKVGCHSFAIETPDKLVTVLGEYLNKPTETEKKWFSGELLK
jgi:hypothetical protein